MVVRGGGGRVVFFMAHIHVVGDCVVVVGLSLGFGPCTSMTTFCAVGPGSGEAAADATLVVLVVLVVGGVAAGGVAVADALVVLVVGDVAAGGVAVADESVALVVGGVAAGVAAADAFAKSLADAFAGVGVDLVGGTSDEFGNGLAAVVFAVGVGGCVGVGVTTDVEDWAVAWVVDGGAAVAGLGCCAAAAGAAVEGCVGAAGGCVEPAAGPPGAVVLEAAGAAAVGALLA